MKAWNLIFWLSLFILLLGILISNDTICDYLIPPIPDYTISEQWGSRNLKDNDVRPFEIKIENSVLDNLKDRIKNRTVSFSYRDSNFRYGFNIDYLNNLMHYWTTKYQWRDWERTINKLPQYVTNIKGLQIHFIHVKPIPKPGKTTIPILLLHGWPGSFFEFHKLIPLLSSLSDKESFNFEVVCPSLVGFGWSDSAQRGDFGLIDMSDIMVELMKRLKITRKFYVQGGDYGSMIAGIMSQLYPEQITGIHINMPEAPVSDIRYMAKLFLGSILPTSLHFMSEEEIKMTYPFSEKMLNVLNQMGYFWLQATRPSTVGVALSDSPAGLAAYIIEKFGSWSNNLSYHLNNPNGGIENLKISKDEMLTNVMIYYLTNSISTSVMLYKEIFAKYMTELSKIPIFVPTGIASFPHDLIQTPKVFTSIKYRDIRQFTYMPRGGHFAAIEEPELLAKDVISFVKLVEHGTD